MDLASLPEDLLIFKVLPELPLKELQDICHTSAFFRNLCKHPQLWKSKLQLEYPGLTFPGTDYQEYYHILKHESYQVEVESFDEDDRPRPICQIKVNPFHHLNYLQEELRKCVTSSNFLAIMISKNPFEIIEAWLVQDNGESLTVNFSNYAPIQKIYIVPSENYDVNTLLLEKLQEIARYYHQLFIQGHLDLNVFEEYHHLIDTLEITLIQFLMHLLRPTASYVNRYRMYRHLFDKEYSLNYRAVQSNLPTVSQTRRYSIFGVSLDLAH